MQRLGGVDMTDATITGSAVCAAYRETRERLTALLRAMPSPAADTPVPTCPGWTVHDVAAHLSGGIADAVNGRLDGAGSDEWTARQVDERREWPLATILDEWSENAPTVEPMLDAAGEIGRQAVADVVSHEHDIRTALSVPGARDSDAVRVGLTFAANRIVEEAAARGAALHISTEGMRFGPDDAPVRLTGPAFELLRAITGRRSVAQIRALNWQGDPSRVIPAFWWLSINPSSIDIHE